MLRISHHSDPFPHPTPTKVVQSGTIMFWQDVHCFFFGGKGGGGGGWGVCIINIALKGLYS